MLRIETPININLTKVAVGSKVEITGTIYTARDAVMAKIINLIENNLLHTLPFSLKGAAIFHTAVSQSGFGPTSSNKEEIESAMGMLSKAGVKLHLGKGVIKQQTINDISYYGAIYIVIPPVSALLQSRLIAKKIIAYEEEGIEALFELKVNSLPGIVTAGKGISLFHH